MKAHITIIFFTITILFYSCNGQTQKIGENKLTLKEDIPLRSEIKKIVDSIEAGNFVAITAGIGASGYLTPQWKYFQQLKKDATAEELISLTNHKNGAVRCYAFQALAGKQSDKVFSILLTHLYDTAKVKTISGCNAAMELVGDYYINVVTPKYIDLEAYKLTIEERKKLDNILKNDDKITLYARELVLRNLK